MKWRYSIHQIRNGEPRPVDAIAGHDAAIDAAEMLAQKTRLEVKVWDRRTGRCIYCVPAATCRRSHEVRQRGVFWGASKTCLPIAVAATQTKGLGQRFWVRQ